MAQRLNLQFAPVNFSTSGNNTLVSAFTVPANSGMQPSFMNIWGLALVIGGITNVTFQDGPTNGLSGPMPMLANGAIFLTPGSEPWFIVSPTQAFILNSSNAVQISGWVVYSQ